MTTCDRSGQKRVNWFVDEMIVSILLRDQLQQRKLMLAKMIRIKQIINTEFRISRKTKTRRNI
jgi:hypothetical protein